MPNNLFCINWTEVLQGDFLFRFPRDFIVASSVHVKITDKGMTVKYEPSLSQKHIREKTQSFIQVPCDNSASELWKFSMGIWKKNNTVLNPSEFCFTIEKSLVFLSLSKLLFSVLLFLCIFSRNNTFPPLNLALLYSLSVFHYILHGFTQE